MYLVYQWSFPSYWLKIIDDLLYKLQLVVDLINMSVFSNKYSLSGSYIFTSVHL